MIDSNHLLPQGKAANHAPENGHDGPVELMDVRGLADMLHLDRQTIYNWLHQHKLSGIKVGGVWRFDRRAVEAWLHGQTVEARRAGVSPPAPTDVPPQGGA